VSKSGYSLTSKSVEGATLTLEGVDDVHGGHGLPLGVLGVGDGIADDVLQEDLEDSAGLLVDEAGNALDTATTGQTTDGGLGDALDVVSKDLAMPLGSALAKSFSSFATSGHGVEVVDVDNVELTVSQYGKRMITNLLFRSYL
jgi:hypothetical protein